MFRQLAAAVGTNVVLTTYRPSQLAEYLETLWSLQRLAPRQIALGPGLGAFHEDMARPATIDPPPLFPADPPLPVPPVGWHHIVYAYMLENTRVVDIFRRVVFEWLTGERLPTPSQPTQRWLQVTEQLFFGIPWAYSVRAVRSSIRPDGGAVRRNAYYRLLGMDLNHGTDDGQVYPFVKPDVANREFATIFEALLVEVWRAHVNQFTAVSENLTDINAIENLVRRLREMMQSRRIAGALSREEYEAVSLLSWMHLTVEFDTPIVVDLSARGESSADRLTKIGERVGLPAHARSDAYFQLAVPMSTVLLAIEGGGIAAPTDLFANGGLHTGDMLQIITHWSVATGRNIKDPTARQPISSVLRQLAPMSAPVGLLGAPTGGHIGQLMR